MGSLGLVTRGEKKTFHRSMKRLFVKNIARVVVEGSCCGTIYSRINYRGKNHSIDSPGEFLTEVRRVKSVVLRRC